MRVGEGRTLFQVLEEIFSMRPRSTGNADLDEVLLYNYLAAVCATCGASPAHRHGDVLHCDQCCRGLAKQTIAQAEAGTPTQ